MKLIVAFRNFANAPNKKVFQNEFMCCQRYGKDGGWANSSRDNSIEIHMGYCVYIPGGGVGICYDIVTENEIWRLCVVFGVMPLSYESSLLYPLNLYCSVLQIATAVPLVSKTYSV